jgi:glycosyltransferase 2 family protein
MLEGLWNQVKLGTGLLQSRRFRRWVVNLAPGILCGLLLYLALRGARLDVTWRLIGQVQPLQLLAIFMIDAAVFLVFGLRWWFLARVQARGISLADAVLVRLAAFGISYFTPGPQFGGEPLQVLHLGRKQRTSLVHATAIVALDKLIELLGNYFFLIAGAIAIVGSGLFPLGGRFAIVGIVMVMALGAWPMVHLLLLRSNVHPLSLGINRVWRGRNARSRVLRSIRLSEHLIGRFCRRRPRRLIAALTLSLCASGLGVAEYALILSSFSAALSLGQTLAAWTAGWLSFLVPAPGGLGALEASQVLALGHFGVAAEAAIAVSLLMRARDIVMGGTGILLVALRWQSWTSRSRQLGVP